MLSQMKLAVPVLAYRAISPVCGVPPAEFSAHLEALARAGWRSVSVSELVDFLKSGKPLREKPYVITFDDTYLDNWVYALPVLRRSGVRAAFGCVSAYLHDESPRPQATGDASTLPALPTSREAWDLALEEDDYSAFMSREEVRVLVADEGHELVGHTHTHQLCFASARPGAPASDADPYIGVHGIFPEPEEEGLVYPIASAYTCDGFWPGDALGDGLLRRSTAERIEFCTTEFALNRERLGQAAGVEPRALLWPLGTCDDASVQAASLAGFEAAFTNESGPNRPGTDLFRLHRERVESGTPSGELVRRLERLVTPSVWQRIFS